MDLSKNNAPEDSEVYKEDRTLQEQFMKTDGRLNRLRYIKRILVLLLVWIVICVLITLIFGDDMGKLSSTGDVLVSVIAAGMLIPYYCLDVRRLHDMDKDSTLAKIIFVLGIAMLFVSEESLFNPSAPAMILYLISVVTSIYILFMPGTKGANKYGADPLG